MKGRGEMVNRWEGNQNSSARRKLNDSKKKKIKEGNEKEGNECEETK